MTLQELQAKRKAIQDKIDAILAKDSLTADEREQVATLESEFDQLSADITAAEELAKADADLRKRNAERSAQLAKSTRKTTAQSATLAADDTVADDVRVKDPAKFRSLGEQLQAIAGVAMTGREDNRLTWDNLAPATGAAVSSVPSDGGYLIQKEFSTELLGRMNDLGQVKSRVRTITIGPNADGLRLPTVNETSRATGSRWGGVQVYWGAEADAATAKKPAFRMMELELKDLIGLAYATNRILQDATALESVFLQAFSEEMNFMIEDALINGSGAGMPLGILNCPALVSVSKETGQAAATIVSENINKMYARLWSRSEANAVWFCNKDIMPQLQSLNMAAGQNGQLVYLPPGGLSEAPYARLMGKPVLPIEYCATLGTVGDLILADMTQVIGIEKGGMAADQSIHVRFTTNENTFRFIYRYDAQPVWNSALTPFKGSATQSPFVALATRS